MPVGVSVLVYSLNKGVYPNQKFRAPPPSRKYKKLHSIASTLAKKRKVKAYEHVGVMG